LLVLPWPRSETEARTITSESSVIQLEKNPMQPWFNTVAAVVLVTAIGHTDTAVAAEDQKAAPPAPGIVLQGANHYRFKIGDITVTSLSDGTVPQDLHKLLFGTSAEKTDALLAQGYLANPVEASINVFLIDMGGKRVLVDTGSGGVPERHRPCRQDVDFFLDRANAAKSGVAMQYFDEAIKTLKPYVDAGKVKSSTGRQKSSGLNSHPPSRTHARKRLLHASQRRPADNLHRRHHPCVGGAVPRSRDHNRL
jgi:hypothetical protein